MENTPTAVKSAIIGKVWLNDSVRTLVPAAYTIEQDTTFGANESYVLGNFTFRTDRNLTTPIAVKAGEKLYFYANKKRTGFRDPDYSVSVLLPVAVAEAVIEGSKLGAAAWRAAHPVA